MKSKTRLPRFIQLIGKDGVLGAAMRLTKVEKNKAYYWRDAGRWGLYVFWNGKDLLTIGPHDPYRYDMEKGEMISNPKDVVMDHLHGLKIKPISEEVWRKANGDYAPKTIRKDVL